MIAEPVDIDLVIGENVKQKVASNDRDASQSTRKENTISIPASAVPGVNIVIIIFIRNSMKKLHVRKIRIKLYSHYSYRFAFLLTFIIYLSCTLFKNKWRTINYLIDKLDPAFEIVLFN